MKKREYNYRLFCLTIEDDIIINLKILIMGTPGLKEKRKDVYIKSCIPITYKSRAGDNECALSSR